MGETNWGGNWVLGRAIFSKSLIQFSVEGWGCVPSQLLILRPNYGGGNEDQFSSIQSLSHVRIFVTPWTAAHQVSLTITNSWSLLKLITIESVMTSNQLIPFSCLQSFPALGSFPISQFFPSGGQSIAVSASISVLPMNIQDWFPLGWTEDSGGNEDNGNLLQMVVCMHCCTQCPWPCHHQPTPLPETPGHSWHVWVSLLWGHCSFLLGTGAHKVLFVPSKSWFPQFYVSSGGSW